MDKKTNKKLKTLDISTTLFDNVAFVFLSRDGNISFPDPYLFIHKKSAN